MPDRKVYKDYSEADVRDLCELAAPSSWQDVVHFLEKRGDETTRLSPGEDAHMIADAKQAMIDNVPFSRNPEQAHRVLKSHRNPELVRQEEQKWATTAAGKAPTEPLPKRREA